MLGLGCCREFAYDFLGGGGVGEYGGFGHDEGTIRVKKSSSGPVCPNHRRETKRTVGTCAEEQLHRVAHEYPKGCKFRGTYVRPPPLASLHWIENVKYGCAPAKKPR
mmetsp:Transcript_167/g.358  ORF Transcript_167/g.358 Transcript_167/m.358 type:complete len:107 (-) Transcript_167:590-910(-)